MTKRSLGVAAVFLAGCAVGGASSQLAVLNASAQQSATLTKWEYFCANRPADYEDTNAEANRFGAQSWEMITEASRTWCFKRPKR